jgi:hypothetical protein
LSIESRDRLIEGSLRISHFENDTNFRRACSPTGETKFSAVSRRDLIDPPKHKILNHTAHRRSCLAKPMISSVYIPVRLVTISGQIQRIWSSRRRWQNRRTLSKGQVDAVLGYSIRPETRSETEWLSCIRSGLVSEPLCPVQNVHRESGSSSAPLITPPAR